MPWMPAMVCVVQIGSSVRTSACSTARSTFCCAWTTVVDVTVEMSAIATAMQARIDQICFHKLIDCPPGTDSASERLEYARRSLGAQYAPIPPLRIRAIPCGMPHDRPARRHRHLAYRGDERGEAPNSATTRARAIRPCVDLSRQRPKPPARKARSSSSHLVAAGSRQARRRSVAVIPLDYFGVAARTDRREERCRARRWRAYF